MKKIQGDCVSNWLVLLTGAAQLLLVCGVNTSLPGMFNSHYRPFSGMTNECRNVLIPGIRPNYN